ncbi:MAG: AlpA family transcriptional regulator [Pseudomonadota bacterium]
MKSRPEASKDWSIYRGGAAVQSRGRVPLTRAFEDYCCMRWGLSGDEIADAAEGGDGGADVRTMVAMAIDLLGNTFIQGAFPAWARPIGGGVPEEIPAENWELDDLTPRFASGTMNMRRPFDLEAEPTHTIFLDEATRDAFLAACCVDLPGYAAMTLRTAHATAGTDDVEGAVDAPIGWQPDAILRRDEVIRMTGLKRSTIYARMSRGEFPQSVDLGGRQTGWIAADIAEWLASRPKRAA